ncbi:metallophosphoesterase [Halodesulfurarchaeum sp.]|uniref:metallophosphoesterase n=1 Tax=Halodesulfurarchaeum sp. TaxID=1980530 RepID=UPI001BBC9B23|nr:metallophosphoesterase [Halodesulfurarchaeum sp.]
MDPFPRVEYEDRAVWFPDAETLVLADLHLGRVRQSRVDFPVGDGKDLPNRLDRLCERYEPTAVVVAGDLVHAFDTVPYGVADAIQNLVDVVVDAGAELIVTSGNHDPTLERVESLDPVDEYHLDSSTVVHHGHEQPTANTDRYVIGHEHPALTIEGNRRPCYLECWAQHGEASVLVLPAFSRVAVGTTVNDLKAADSMSPLLTDTDACRPIVSTTDESLSFPPLGKLRPHL